MLAVWHPRRWRTLCMSQDEKKEKKKEIELMLLVFKESERTET